MSADQAPLPRRRPASDYLGRLFTVQVDRPLGSAHPLHGFIYLLNYGYIAGEMALDGEAQDAYILGVAEVLEQFSGICIAVIERLDDVEDKLVISAPGQRFSEEEIRERTYFQERFFHIRITLLDDDQEVR